MALIKLFQEQRRPGVRLVDSIGNEVASMEGQGAMSLDTRLIPNGLYYMTVTNEGGSFSESIIIEH